MAVAHGSILVSPSCDTRTKTQLDSVAIESGTYITNENITIGGITTDKWTVIAISNETKTNLHCFTQIWIPSTNASRMFVRTAAASATSYTSFKTFVDTSYLQTNYAQNKSSTPVEIYVQTTQPTVESGKTKIWINPNA